MTYRRLFFIVLSMSLAASPVFAGHDHGSMGAAAPAASQSPTDEKNVKESEMLINNCAQLVAALERRINKLQAEMYGKGAGVSVRNELKTLEQKLKEANDIARPLQIF